MNKPSTLARVTVAALGIAAVRCTLANPLGYLQSGGTTACDTTATASDAKNCGACGHDCQGGACQAGVCQPVTVASGMTSPFDLAVDTSSVYFTLNDPDAGAVVRCSLDGCDAEMDVLAPHESGATRLVVDDTNVYWTSSGGGFVHACALGGCDGSPTVVATGQTSAQGIAVNGSTIFWGENDLDGGTISSCPLAGCPTAGPDVLAVVGGAGTLALGGDDLFWVVNPRGNIQECATSGCDGGAPTAFAPFLGGGYSPYFVTVYGGYVYWTDDETTGGIYACPVAGCGDGPALIASETNPKGLAVDASGVYWATDSSFGVIRRCPTTGCSGATPTTLATGQNVPFAVALTATSVLWTTTSGGTVMKVAKPLVSP